MGWTFDRCGGQLAVDFANTVSGRHTDSPVERLPDYAELVSFAHQTEIIDATRARSLLRRAGRRPAEAAAVVDAARQLREPLYRLLAAIADKRAPDPADTAALGAELSRLHLTGDLCLGWREEPSSLDDFLGAVVLAAVELVTDPEQRARVRLCQAPDCVWLFVDTSRNRSRRWCDMRQCGNRMKARRHHARTRRP